MFAVSIWVASIYVAIILLAAIPLLLLVKPTWGVIYCFLNAFLIFCPVWTPLWVKRFVKFSIESGMTYFSVKIIAEDEDALKPGQPYMIGFEPHSVMPVALPMVFNDVAPGLPKGLKGVVALGTSAANRAPVVRHLWWWLGVRSVSKKTISDILDSGRSCALIPGGVREIQFMQKGIEVAYLTRRHGFVRLAMRKGVPLVPAFAFGQTATYNYWKVGPPLAPTSFINWVARICGVQPLYPWGRFFSPIPNKVPITVAIGQPIEVPHDENPDSELVS